MYICSELLYRCRLGVQSLSSQCRLASSRVCRLYVQGGWTEAACLVHSHANRRESADDLQTIKTRTMCLVSGRCRRHWHPAQQPKAIAHAPVSNLSTDKKKTHTHTPSTNQCSSSYTSQRGTGPTFAQAANSTARAPLRNHCLQTMCTVKDFYLYAVLCASRSLFLLLR